MLAHQSGLFSALGAGLFLLRATWIQPGSLPKKYPLPAWRPALPRSTEQPWHTSKDYSINSPESVFCQVNFEVGVLLSKIQRNRIFSMDPGYQIGAFPDINLIFLAPLDPLVIFITFFHSVTSSIAWVTCFSW
uniref:Uncharacterized protein n=1 Tax=Candidatus Kentrum sp. LPFa TaxID=2126335 RepID=A0A450X5B8_9GAMM|nr:MAG: hypothetical protein BECKLPF1236A_GA0070988_104171 [Candidatus Kentron sp. LPFa]VFK35824.1 MAG: hypothetical protein BECKLPF1236C_GA0070990_104281 [Candidatus Kentron sp. LPFa]